MLTNIIIFEFFKKHCDTLSFVKSKINKFLNLLTKYLEITSTFSFLFIKACNKLKDIKKWGEYIFHYELYIVLFKTMYSKKISFNYSALIIYSIIFKNQ